jgi:hypothetical protein
MIGAGRNDSYSPRRHWCFKEPDFGSKGLGPTYRSLMTFGQADDLVYEFATHTASPGRPAERKEEVCIETSDWFLTSRLVGRNPLLPDHGQTGSNPPWKKERGLAA